MNRSWFCMCSEPFDVISTVFTVVLYIFSGWHSLVVGSKPPDLIPVTVYSERMLPLVVLYINMTVCSVCTFTFSMHIHIQYAHSHSVCTFSMYMNALVIMYMYQSTQLLYSSSCHIHSKQVGQ